MNIKPNPEFINSVPAEHRKKWHDALVSCEKPQGRGQLIAKDGGWCCLMVGYTAFGGQITDETPTLVLPPINSEFSTAMACPNPEIGAENELPVSSGYLNDIDCLTFSEIAKLVYPEAYEGSHER